MTYHHITSGLIYVPTRASSYLSNQPYLGLPSSRLKTKECNAFIASFFSSFLKFNFSLYTIILFISWCICNKRISIVSHLSSYLNEFLRFHIIHLTILICSLYCQLVDMLPLDILMYLRKLCKMLYQK